MRRDIFRDDGACIHNRIVTNGNTRHHDCPRAQIAIGANPRVESNASCQIVSQDHSFLVDHRLRPDVDPLRPGAVDVSAWRDRGGRMDIHFPQEPPDHSIPRASCAPTRPLADTPQVMHPFLASQMGRTGGEIA